MVILENKCILGCPEGMILYENECLQKCPYKMIYDKKLNNIINNKE